MEASRSKRTAKSRWRSLRCIMVFIGMRLRQRSRSMEFQLVTDDLQKGFYGNPSSLTSVEVGESALQPSSLTSGESAFQPYDPLYYHFSETWIPSFRSPPDCDIFETPDPYPPRKSKWSIVKHVIVATLRLKRLLISMEKPDAGMQPMISLPNLPDLALTSIIATDGSSGKVYRVVHKKTGQTYSLKEFIYDYDSSQREEISREIQILKQLDHPNIVKCYDVVFTDAGLIFLLLEPLDRGPPTITSESDLASLTRQLLLGLTYLHRNRFSHGDIKPSNIFVNHAGQVKLLYSGKTLSKTPAVFAEIGGVHDGFSWDIWGVGLCILKFCRGLNWFDRDVDKQLLKLDLNWPDMDEDIVPPSSENERALVWRPSMELLRLLSSCMQTDVLKRWTAEQLVDHPFFYQLTPLKKDVHLPLKKEEFQIPPFKKEEFQLPLKKEKELFHESEELLSPVKKKSKFSLEDEDTVVDLESLKDHAVPERCIEHCKLFQPDCEFEKDKLVHMWIAEECIELGVTKRTEDVGNLYFDALVQEEVIVPSRFDNLHRRMKYNFNTSQVSDELLKRGNYLRLNASNLDEIYGGALHLTWQCKRLDRTFFDALKNFKQLHTLVVHEDGSDSISQLPNDIFLGLKLLRTLDMSRTHIEEVPGSIGKLESLRYLDISETPIKRLPESLDRLYCLQTLNLKACVGIVALPRGLGRLVNLRHLDLDIVSQLKSLPRGMGNLIKLQTLQAFIVGKNDGCGIRELKNMNEISGSFCISKLENVSNAEEAKEAALSDKKYIDKLELRWSNCENDDFQDPTEILESLQPHFSLQELQLTFYGGSKLPSWISNPSYVDLSSITLYKCINSDVMPSIGELPCLKILHIVDMRNVRIINTVFCRNHKIKVFTAFPRLEKLTLDNMLTLEEWTGVEKVDFPCLRHASIRYCPKLCVLPSLAHMFSLEHLEISDCTQLISLPEGLLPDSLESLIIRGCPRINERCRKDEGLDWAKIASVGNIWIDLEKISLD